MEGLIPFFIIVVVGIIKLVNFLGKLDKGGESNLSSSTQSSSNSKAVSRVKAFLNDMMQEEPAPIINDTYERPVVSPTIREEQQLSVAPKGETFDRKQKETNSLTADLKKPSQLKRAFILKEILDRPVSERL